jgi:hypothetical protein
MLQTSQLLRPEVEITQEASFRELAHWAIGIVRRQLLLITSIAVVGASIGVLSRIHRIAIQI